MSAADCIFCKIVAGAIPCHQLYRTAHCLAFFDINPLAEDHFLVIPTEHAVHMHECSAAFHQEALGAGVRVLRALYPEKEVMHAHVHFIPKTGSGDGLGVAWRSREAQQSVLAARARSIRDALGS